MSRFGYPVAHKSYFPTIREESFDVYTGQVDIDLSGLSVGKDSPFIVYDVFGELP